MPSNDQTLCRSVTVPLKVLSNHYKKIAEKEKSDKSVTKVVLLTSVLLLSQ